MEYKGTGDRNFQGRSKKLGCLSVKIFSKCSYKQTSVWDWSSKGLYSGNLGLLFDNLLQILAALENDLSFTFCTNVLYLDEKLILSDDLYDLFS